MICEVCLIKRKKKDFYIPDICYKCLYKKKTQELQDTGYHEGCKICGQALGKGRSRYCSTPCQIKGKYMLKSHKHWTKSIRNPIWGENGFLFKTAKRISGDYGIEEN